VAQKIELHIENPCQENLNKMTTTDRGVFCSSCSKEVIDFSLMSNDEILQQFKNYTGGGCGIFRGDQLGRPLTGTPRRSIAWKYAWQLLIPAFLLTRQAKGQTQTVIAGTVAKRPVTTVKDYSPHKRDHADKMLGLAQVKGIVLDSNTRQPVSNASIGVPDYGIVGFTDSSGRFAVTIKPGSHELTISSAGYRLNNYKLNENHGAGELIIEMLPDIKELDGVTVTGYGGQRLVGAIAGGISIIRKDSIWAKTKELFTFSKPAVKIFPNPVRRGASFRVKVDLPAGKEYTLELIDMNGNRVAGKKIMIQYKNQVVEQEAGEQLAAGTYVVRITDSSGTGVQSLKLTIQ